MASSTVSNPNPRPDMASRAGEQARQAKDNASSSLSSATLGRSGHPSRGAYTYNIDRFLDQDIFEDANLHGRVPEHDFRPKPKACIPFYKAKAANAIEDFNTVFNNGGGR